MAGKEVLVLFHESRESFWTTGELLYVTERVENLLDAIQWPGERTN